MGASAEASRDAPQPRRCGRAEEVIERSRGSRTDRRRHFVVGADGDGSLLDIVNRRCGHRCAGQDFQTDGTQKLNYSRSFKVSTCYEGDSVELIEIIENRKARLCPG